MATAITAEEFEDKVLNSDKPVLVDFWAEWCGPCKMLTPIMSNVAKEVSGSANVYKVNIDEHPSLATKYNVTSIPTVVAFDKGDVLESVIGVHPQNKYIDIVS